MVDVYGLNAINAFNRAILEWLTKNHRYKKIGAYL